MTNVLQEAIKANIAVELEDVYTALQGTITDVSNLKNNRISVQPSVKRLNSSGQEFDYPILPDVPIQWPSGGGAVMTFPLKVGDDVLLIFSMASITEFQLSNTGTVKPSDTRNHALSDAIAIPCIYRDANQPEPNEDDVEIRYKDAKLALKDDSSIVLNNKNGSHTISEDGTQQLEVKETISVTNNTGELIDLLSQTLTEISNAQVNTLLGPQPLINKAAITALIALVDSFKE